jgi:hypothetical protein
MIHAVNLWSSFLSLLLIFMGAQILVRLNNSFFLLISVNDLVIIFTKAYFISMYRIPSPSQPIDRFIDM